MRLKPVLLLAELGKAAQGIRDRLLSRRREDLGGAELLQCGKGGGVDELGRALQVGRDLAGLDVVRKALLGRQQENDLWENGGANGVSMTA